MRLRALLVAIAPLVVLGAALTGAAADARAPAPSRLTAFGDCRSFAGYMSAHALPLVGRYGPRVGIAVGAAPPVPGKVADGQEVAAPEVSGTNVQEEGVDEPDVVKTDGRHLYVMNASTLYVFDIKTGEPKLVGSLTLRGFGHQLLLSGDRVLALTTYWDDPVLQPQPAQVIAPEPYPVPEPATRLFEIDVSDPGEPKLLNTLTMEGYYVSARMRGSVARVVMSTPPSPWPVDYETVEAQRRAIRHTRLSTWMPDAVLRDRVRDRRKIRRMVACDDVRRPLAYSGPGMLTVLTVDLARGLKPLDSDSLMTDAQTIYASKRNLFVAAERWFDPTVSDPDREVDAGRFTAIHKFGLDPESAEYRGSGEVRGFVLNQFSLSEHDGALRVATTDQPPWRANAEQRESESFVSVLGEKLNEIGRVGGLGRGERIFAVRFLGDKGYVVTFRQIDPLYTLDLSNPEKPAVRGELELLGFSSYLHPIGDDLLLGLGQDANDQGQTRGTQLSLFDVSNLSAPKRLHSRALGESTSSAAEYDHHAFLYWPPTKLTVVPVSAYRPEDTFNGAFGFRVDRDEGITQVGSAEHEGGYILRSLVAQGRLFTVSDRGVLSSSLDTLAPGAFTPFGP
jgi:uncharacterized secreted protein with C-terminal beta-propeller domain